MIFMNNLLLQRSCSNKLLRKELWVKLQRSCFWKIIYFQLKSGSLKKNPAVRRTVVFSRFWNLNIGFFWLIFKVFKIYVISQYY